MSGQDATVGSQGGSGSAATKQGADASASAERAPVTPAIHAVPDPAPEPPKAVSSGSGAAAPAAPSAPSAAPPTRLGASIAEIGKEDDLQELYQLVAQLEKELGMPVWLLCQGQVPPPSRPWDQIGEEVAIAMREERELDEHDEIAVLIHSPGGDARCAYNLGNAFAQREKGFVAIVPYLAKSAATLMALGAKRIVLGRLGELGPLDAQLIDMDKEQIGSALDEVQSLERLHKFALDAFANTLVLLKSRTQKKYDSLLPIAGEFASGLVRPLFESVDVIHYTSLSRTLKVAEDYAVRLMQRQGVPRKKSLDIANKLISDYTEHGFVIDLKEAQLIGLPAEPAQGHLSDLIEEIRPLMSQVIAIGRVQAEEPEEDA